MLSNVYSSWFRVRLRVRRIYRQLWSSLSEKVKIGRSVKPNLTTFREESVRVITRQVIPMTGNARASFVSSIIKELYNLSVVRKSIQRSSVRLGGFSSWNHGQCPSGSKFPSGHMVSWSRSCDGCKRDWSCILYGELLQHLQGVMSCTEMSTHKKLYRIWPVTGGIVLPSEHLWDVRDEQFRSEEPQLGVDIVASPPLQYWIYNEEFDRQRPFELHCIQAGDLSNHATRALPRFHVLSQPNSTEHNHQIFGGQELLWAHERFPTAECLLLQQGKPVNFSSSVTSQGKESRMI